jgi:adenine-specific DNA-methyltransferase
MLAAAVCKLEGFTYEPSDSVYWMHGKSTENDFIYVTTAHFTHKQLALLSDEVGNKRTLLVMHRLSFPFRRFSQSDHQKNTQHGS